MVTHDRLHDLGTEDGRIRMVPYLQVGLLLVIGQAMDTSSFVAAGAGAPEESREVFKRDPGPTGWGSRVGIRHHVDKCGFCFWR